MIYRSPEFMGLVPLVMMYCDEIFPPPAMIGVSGGASSDVASMAGRYGL